MVFPAFALIVALFFHSPAVHSKIIIVTPIPFQFPAATAFICRQSIQKPFLFSMASTYSSLVVGTVPCAVVSFSSSSFLHPSMRSGVVFSSVATWILVFHTVLSMCFLMSSLDLFLLSPMAADTHLHPQSPLPPRSHSVVPLGPCDGGPVFVFLAASGLAGAFFLCPVLFPSWSKTSTKVSSSAVFSSSPGMVSSFTASSGVPSSFLQNLDHLLARIGISSGVFLFASHFFATMGSLPVISNGITVTSIGISFGISSDTSHPCPPVWGGLGLPRALYPCRSRNCTSIFGPHQCGTLYRHQVPEFVSGLFPSRPRFDPPPLLHMSGKPCSFDIAAAAL